MGRHIRRLGSDPNLTCPSLKRLTSHMGLLTHTFHPPYGNGMVRNLTIFFQNILLLCLELLGVAYKPYTRISSLHDRRDYWYFGGVATAPPVDTLTPIRQLLLTIASIVLPTRTLPLPAIPKALHLRFGGSPSSLHRSPFVAQPSILRYP